MPAKLPCESCSEPFLIFLGQCPHCGESALPHVRMADLPEERQALDKRYASATRAAKKRGCDGIVKDFEEKLSKSVAVIARSEFETEKLASSDDNLYATFYQLLGGGVRVQEGSKWDWMRSMADSALFGEKYKAEIRFASLSLDGIGLSHYGDYSWVIKETMIHRRTAVFEGNLALFIFKLPKKKMYDPPKGYRAVWSERARLGVAKLAGQLDSDTQADAFAEIVLCHGATGEDDEFIEVHIGGPMTVRTLDRVVATRRISKATFKKLDRQLAKFGVALEAHGWTP